MVSQTTRYALQILGYLAGRRDRRVPGEEIAEATGIPPNYLSKILNQLRKSGLVDSQKGWGGGFTLREEALERPISDVMAVIEGSDATLRTDCLFGLPSCDCKNPCPLNTRVWLFAGISTLSSRVNPSAAFSTASRSRTPQSGFLDLRSSSKAWLLVAFGRREAELLGHASCSKDLGKNASRVYGSS